MIDVENEIYTMVTDAAESVESNLECSGVFQRVPQSFPYLYLYQMNSSVQTNYIASGRKDTYANVAFEARVYSNLTFGAKEQVKKIMAAVCDKFKELGFILSSCQWVPNMEDPTIQQMIGRFTAAVGKDNTIYSR